MAGVVQTGTTSGAMRSTPICGPIATTSFLPHGPDTARHPHRQPVLLTATDENPNGATVRFIVDGASPAGIADYERLVFMFDGHDQQQLEDARGHWKRLKNDGHALTYWQQTNDRRWERKA